MNIAEGSGITYYVDNLNPLASDSNSGKELDSPFLTITKAAHEAREGDTVRVLAGTYAETIILDAWSGTESAPITLKADPGVIVTGNGEVDGGSAFSITGQSYIIIEGFTIADTAYKGILVTNSHHISILKNIIYNSGGHVYGEHQQGIHFKTVANSIIDGNISHDNSCVGILLSHGSNDNVISNNYSFSNYSDDPVTPETITDAAGIELRDSDSNLVIHNVVYGNEDSGINMYKVSGDGSQNNMIVGNLVYGNRDHGIDNNNSTGQYIIGNTVQGNHTSGINLEANSFGGTIINNIISDNGLDPEQGRKAYNIYVDDTSISGTTLDYNLYHISEGTYQIKWDSTGYASLATFVTALPSQEAHGLEGDPLFLNPANPAGILVASTGGDYHLRAGSPAIDSANSNAPNQPDTDIEMYARIDDPAIVDTGSGIRTYDDRGAYERQIFVLSVTGITADNKEYDASTAATINTTSATLVGVNPGDNVTLDLSSVVGSFSDNNVGPGKTVYITGLTLAGPDAGKYSLLQPIVAADITRKPITGNFTTENKVYDSTDSATVLTRTVDGLIEGDTVNLVGGTATFDNKNVGTGKIVTLSGSSLDGTDANNYSLASVATTTANITTKHITGSFTASNKVYDGNDTATVLTRSLNDVFDGDNVNLVEGAATFANAEIGENKIVTLTGATLDGVDKDNYILDSVATTTASIFAELDLSDLDLLQSTDQLAWTDVAGSFSSGFNMTLNYDQEYYYLDAANLISNRPLADGLYPFFVDNYPSGYFDYWASKGVDGTLPYAEPWMGIMWDIINGEKPIFYLQVSETDFMLVDGLQYLASGGSLIEPLRINGSYLPGDYTFTGLVADELGFTDEVEVDVAFVSLKGLTVTGISADDKTYDGKTSATINKNNAALVGVVLGDDVVLVTTDAVGTFIDKTVGDGKEVSITGLTITGKDAIKYILTQPTTTANITKRDITVTATGVDKIYDGNTTATVSLSDNRVLGDTLSVTNTSATFANKNVGSGISISVTGISISGIDEGNYNLTSTTTSTTANISAKHITGNFLANSKVYDGTTNALVLARNLNGVIAGDTVTLTGGTATFANKIVGSNKTVTLTGATLDGADKNNYILDSVATTTANITKRDLTVTAIGVEKVFDGTMVASVTFTDNRVIGDVITVTYTSATFANPNAGKDISISVTGISISGIDVGNYNLINPPESTSADIDPKPIIVTARSGQTKMFMDPDPIFTYDCSQIDDPEPEFTGALERAAGENIGSYAINLGTLSAGSNFSISFITADFTIYGYQIFLPLLNK